MEKAKAETNYQDLLVERNIDFHDSKLIDGEFTKFKQLNKEYMYSLSIDRFMVLYRKYAGLTSDYKEYGGWISDSNHGAGTVESQYLSALVNTYVEDGDSEALSRIEKYMSEWKLCQDSYAINDPSNSGYFGPYPLSWLVTLENDGWCNWPFYYNVAHQMCALMDVWTQLKDSNPTVSNSARDILLNYATFFANRINAYTKDQFVNKVSRVEYGHISVQMFKLYLLTGDVNYRNAGDVFQEPKINDKLALNQDPFGYLHANTCLPKIISLCYRYLAHNDITYLLWAQRGFKFITEGREFCTGNISEVEELHPQYEGNTEGFQSCETCCAHNLMELCDLLYQFTGESKYFDYYEKLLYNAIMGSIDPETGMKTYYVSMDSGYYKVYHTAENSFWCCTATGLENFSKLNQFIYYVNDNGVNVNLFLNSEYNDPRTGLKIKQNHEFPSKPQVSIEILEGANTKLKIRDPYWVNGDTVLKINDVVTPLNKDNKGYIVIEKTFVQGDVITLDMPMNFWLNRLPSNEEPNRDAIMYGPLVMSGYIEDVVKNPILEGSLIGKTYHNKIKEELFYNGNSLFDCIKPTGDNLEYVIFAENQNVLIRPFYRAQREKYNLYWDIYKVGSNEYYDFLEKESNAKSSQIDWINVGNWFSESAHNGRYDATWIGNAFTENNRGLSYGGYMSYDIKVEKGVNNVAFIKHISTDTGYSYDVYFNNVKSYSTTITALEGEKRFYYYEYAIPSEMTQYADYVNIKIVCTAGILTTGIYEIKVERGDFALDSNKTINLSAMGETTLELGTKLLEKIVFVGSGNIKLLATEDGTNYFVVGDVTGNGSIKTLCQYSAYKLLSTSGYNGSCSIFADKVESIDPIVDYIANEKDSYYCNYQYATVHTKSSGTVRLRIDWGSIGKITGSKHGFAPLASTMLKVEYTISAKKLSDDLILYYDFENIQNNTVKDLAGNNDAAIVGTSFEMAGRYGKGLNLAGSSYLSLPSFALTNDVTFSAWVKYNDASDALFQRIFDLGSDSANYISNAMCGYFVVNNNGNRINVPQDIYTLTKNTWYNIAVTVSKDIAISYINGVEVSRNERFYHDFSNAEDFVSNYIGKSHVEYTPLLNATIDEVRIYSYPLSKRQLQGLYKTTVISKNEFGSDDYFYSSPLPEIDIDPNPTDIEIEPIVTPTKPIKGGIKLKITNLDHYKGGNK